jgi:hypothetical protein
MYVTVHSSSAGRKIPFSKRSNFEHKTYSLFHLNTGNDLGRLVTVCEYKGVPILYINRPSKYLKVGRWTLDVALRIPSLQTPLCCTTRHPVLRKVLLSNELCLDSIQMLILRLRAGYTSYFTGRCLEVPFPRDHLLNVLL